MDSASVKVNYSIHLDLAHDILKALFEKTEDDRLQSEHHGRLGLVYVPLTIL